MALGPRGFLYDVLKRPLPVLGFIRFPVKFLILATFALPLLAALGLNWLLALPAPNRSRAWRDLAGLAMGLTAVMAAILWFAWKNPLPGSSLAITIGNACVRALFLALLLACLALLRGNRSETATGGPNRPPGRALVRCLYTLLEPESDGCRFRP